MNELKYLLLISGLGVLAWRDAKVQRISNPILGRLTLLRGCLLMVEFAVEPQVAVMAAHSAAYGAVYGMLPLGIAHRLSQEKIGGGDVKLLAVLGMYLGKEIILEALFLSLFYCAVFLTVWNLKKGKVVRTMIPFAPFVLGGTLTVIFLQYF